MHNRRLVAQEDAKQTLVNVLMFLDFALRHMALSQKGPAKLDTLVFCCPDFRPDDIQIDMACICAFRI
jgi:hypothetical protein